IDKDLDQIPGKHYNFMKEVSYEVSKEEAQRFFYFQLLCGDSIDNVPGCKGIGPKKADKALEGIETEEDFQQECLKAYEVAYGKKKGLELIVKYGQVLKIRQSQEEQLWRPTFVSDVDTEPREVA
ncbi:MAG: hypothetical protein ACREQ5_19535, partial [Candidatus Dormibacteria bacterium]